MRLIDADKLLEDSEADWYFKSCVNCAKTIEDALPVIHAHIVIDWLGDSTCSNCGKKYIDVTSKYCSECGAKFDESPVYKNRFSEEGD